MMEVSLTRNKAKTECRPNNNKCKTRTKNESCQEQMQRPNGAYYYENSKQTKNILRTVRRSLLF